MTRYRPDMTLRVVGAGLGRTGTHSLKVALEQLLGGPCYHMLETFGKPDHVQQWTNAAKGERTDWDLIFDGYVAAVDWPTAAYWRVLMERNPAAVVLLSTRESAEAWWTSASKTIFETIDKIAAEAPPLEEMIITMFDRTFTPGWREHDAAIAAYEKHNEEVRATVPPGRLLECRPGDGWEPLCAALAVAVPSEPYPHLNTTAEFRTMTGLDS